MTSRLFVADARESEVPSLLGHMVIYNGHMIVNVTEFKAKCLSFVDRVGKGEEVTITKRGKVVARLVPDAGVQPQPWMALRGTTVRWVADPFAPAVDGNEVEAERT